MTNFSLTRRESLRLSAFAALAFGSGLSFAAPAAAETPLVLWYDKPAGNWTGALALGNGRLGAMVFGGTARERIGLNEDTLWSGAPYEPSFEVSAEIRQEIQRLMFAGDYKGAQNLAEKLQGTPNSQSSYQTVGELVLDFPGHDQVKDYRRDLDLNTAIASVTYTVDGVRFTREALSSPVDQVIAIRLTADRNGKISFSATETSPLPVMVKAGNGNEVSMTGMNGDIYARDKKTPVVKGALKFESRVKVVAEGGQVTAEGDKVTVTGADAATVFIAAATSYKTYKDISADPAVRCTQYLDAAKKPWVALRRAHVAEHQRLFGRITFDLGTTEAAKQATDQRLRDFSKQDDPALVALYFQFGRYLLLSSSRPGSQPANLQGIWNDKLMAPWGGKYTVNINTEMNYWPAQVTNLAETEEPLFRMLSEVAEGSGAQVARRTYGARGWVLHHNTDLWRPAAPIDTAFWGQWQTGGAWLANQLYQSYLFSGDKAYLGKLYPILKGSAAFFEDTLVKEPEHGWLVVLPSNSPEHEIQKGLTASYGTTMDNAILRELFDACIASSTVLGQDPGLRARWKQLRDQLPPNQIGQAGQLQEWIKDWDTTAEDIQHRHMSPLYGIYPGNDITPADAKTFAAARKLVEMRASSGMGWANAWRIGIWARLLDSAKAYEFVELMISKWTEGNLFDKPSVQLDGNFGSTAGIAEMLLQSQNGEIHLLPALPAGKWPNGTITGLRARGGCEVDIEWKAGTLARVTLRSKAATTVKVRYGSGVVSVPLKADRPLVLDGELKAVR
ncbi:glycoside hydrolase family 95 protein [Luteolibacter sp. LG18]|uniref:glycoside hydrolase family 95 protein n=1 Tax=Luteolibacter sp. LG18 TaxID=2819286 RepID=UPI002B2C39EB|nr:alpha/beta hydrolase [Luteolibacter sp. LG18]